MTRLDPGRGEDDGDPMFWVAGTILTIVLAFAVIGIVDTLRFLAEVLP